MVFLYRHAFELMLKSLVIACQTNPGLPHKVKDLAAKGHSLTDYCAYVRAIVDGDAKEHLVIPPGGMAALQSAIDALVKFDPTGFDARYPVDRAGKRRPRAKDSRKFDLEPFISRMESARAFLWGLDEQLNDWAVDLSAARDGVPEMLEELRRIDESS